MLGHETKKLSNCETPQAKERTNRNGLALVAPKV